MPIFSIAFRRSTIARALIIFGAALVALTFGSTQRASAASAGCNAINALHAPHVAPSGQYGMGLMGTFDAGDAITIAGTPSANVYVGPYLEDYIDNRWATSSGGRATFIIAPSETNAWLGWTILANSKPGGLNVTISCKAAGSGGSSYTCGGPGQLCCLPGGTCKSNLTCADKACVSNSSACSACRNTATQCNSNCAKSDQTCQCNCFNIQLDCFTQNSCGGVTGPQQKCLAPPH
jgi:hypothetical protein